MSSTPTPTPPPIPPIPPIPPAPKPPPPAPVIQLVEVDETPRGMTAGTIKIMGIMVAAVVVVSAIGGIGVIALDGDPTNDGQIAIIATVATNFLVFAGTVFPVALSMHKQMNSLKDELVTKSDQVGYARRESEESERAQGAAVVAARAAGVIEGEADTGAVVKPPGPTRGA